MSSEREDEEPVRLRCLGGHPAPRELAAERGRLARLSEAAIAQLGPLLEGSAIRPSTVDEVLETFGRRFEVAEADLRHVLRIGGTLLRQAAAMDLGESDLVDDVLVLWPGHEAMHRVMVEVYARTRPALRESLLQDALLSHGNVLTDIDWRVDLVMASRAAARLEQPVTVLTLQYRDRAGQRHLSLQLTPEQLKRAASVLVALSQQPEQQLGRDGD